MQQTNGQILNLTEDMQQTNGQILNLTEDMQQTNGQFLNLTEDMQQTNGQILNLTEDVCNKQTGKFWTWLKIYATDQLLRFHFFGLKKIQQK